jgi:hypothetical protein
MEQAIGGLGATMMDIGAELAQRKSDAQDDIALAELANIRNNAEAKFAQFESENPDQTKYAPEMHRLQQLAQKQFDSLPMSKGARKKGQTMVDGWKQMTTDQTQLLVTKKTIDTAVAKTTAGYMSAYAEGRDVIDEEGNILQPQEVILQEVLMLDAMSKKYNPDEIVLEVTAAKGKAEEMRINDMTNKGEYEAAFDLVDASQHLDPIDKDSMYNHIRASQNRKKEKTTEVRKVQVGVEAKGLLDTTLAGDTLEANVFPENKPLVDRINTRIASGDINTSDGSTYDAVERRMLQGEYFSSEELLSLLAGTHEAGGATIAEVNQLVELNKGNEKLTQDQKRRLATQNTALDSRYKSFKGLYNLQLQVGPEGLAFTEAALEQDMNEQERVVRNMVLQGRPDDEIHDYINKVFERDADDYLDQTGWPRWLTPAKYDWSMETRNVIGIEARQRRFIDAIKSITTELEPGETVNMDRLNALINVYTGE